MRSCTRAKAFWSAHGMGYDLTYHEYAGGHEMLSWRGGIADRLKLLLPNDFERIGAAER